MSPPLDPSPRRRRPRAHPRRWRRRRRIGGHDRGGGCAGLGALLLIFYANSFSAGLTFDNNVLIAQDPRLRVLDYDHLRQIFTNNYWWPVASNLYQYAFPGPHNGSDKPDVWSNGNDGQPSTADDIVNW